MKILGVFEILEAILTASEPLTVRIPPLPYFSIL